MSIAAFPVSQRARAPITRQMVHVMLDAAIPFDGPFELIEGDILYKTSKNEPHVFVTMQAVEWLAGIFGHAYVRQESPISLTATNEPEPDVAVLSHDRRYYLTAGTPPAADVRLLIEVADSTLPFDLTVKARLYADAGIPEYWVIDVNGRQAHIHRNPVNGAYQSLTVHPDTATLSPLAAPTATIQLATLLP